MLYTPQIILYLLQMYLIKNQGSTKLLLLALLVPIQFALYFKELAIWKHFFLKRRDTGS